MKTRWKKIVYVVWLCTNYKNDLKLHYSEKWKVGFLGFWKTIRGTLKMICFIGYYMKNWDLQTHMITYRVNRGECRWTILVLILFSSCRYVFNRVEKTHYYQRYVILICFCSWNRPCILELRLLHCLIILLPIFPCISLLVSWSRFHCPRRLVFFFYLFIFLRCFLRFFDVIVVGHTLI